CFFRFRSRYSGRSRHDLSMSLLLVQLVSSNRFASYLVWSTLYTSEEAEESLVRMTMTVVVGDVEIDVQILNILQFGLRNCGIESKGYELFPTLCHLHKEQSENLAS
ncbi:hypothetical protein BDD12DRAFT_848252, partial [Trichophaea hybrida]